VSGPVAALFRVRVQILEASEASEYGAVSGRHHATLGVVAPDAEVAAMAGRVAVAERDGVSPFLARVVSVEFVEGVNVLITSSPCTGRGVGGRSNAHRTTSP
jgi:hypothetical protein